MLNINMEINQKTSSGRITRHMNEIHVFLKNHVDAGYITIEHFPASKMVGDFLQIHLKFLILVFAHPPAL